MTALEFALILPVLVTLLLGIVEFGRFVMVNQKLQNSSFILADLAARDRTLSEAQLDNIFLAVRDLFDPFDFETNGRALVSAVSAPTSGPAVVRWQRRSAGGIAANSALGLPNAAAVLPSGFVLRPGESLIVAEVFFEYEPIFGTTVLARTLSRVAYYRPRLGTLETLTP